MTTHSQSVGRLFKLRHSAEATDGPARGSDVSVAKITVIGAIATALIGAVPAVYNMMKDEPGTVAIPTTETRSNDRVFVDDPMILSDSGKTLTISGTADPFVETVGLTVRQRDTKAPVFTGTTNVTDGKWNLVATSDQAIPQPLEVKAYYKERPVTVAGITKASYVFRLDPSTPPAPPPGQRNGCPTPSANACFSGPGWSAPSIYESE
ncbi:hypothetical protein VST63_05680 [Mycolicibacterium sp. 050232]|uniref:hypothetical protein n=1 Tax=Mycolicibacterium sp. 050232 TaxID=3113982 RepID=UPI002E2D365F|nr:hypothetical protein [Mycolicibacterium sp. 050232]MED5811846.1 hypothetical protein [Mycolicibacterium sp. 050232]